MFYAYIKKFTLFSFIIIGSILFILAELLTLFKIKKIMSTLKFVISHDELKKLMESSETIHGAKKLIQLELTFDSSTGVVTPTLHAANLHKLADGTLQASTTAARKTCPNPPCTCC